MDKDNANFKKVCTSVKKILKQEPILLNIPIDHKFQPYNGGPDFNGVIDLVDECIYFHDKVTDQHWGGAF